VVQIISKRNLPPQTLCSSKLYILTQIMLEHQIPSYDSFLASQTHPVKRPPLQS
jgi:hypothetical protein